MNLNDLARDALTGNDIEAFEKMLMLRKECTRSGIHTDEVTRIVKEVLNEDSKPATMPEAKAKQATALRQLNKEMSKLLSTTHYQQ